MASVDVVDPTTVRLNLSAPFSPLLAQLADRAGMMVSPKAAQAAGDKFGAKPVCSGPFKFVERVAQDRIVLERYAELLEQGRRSTSTRSSTCRSPTRRCASPTCSSGQLDFIERVAPSDVAQLKSDTRFKIAKITEIGYQGITINVGKSDLAQKNPLGKDPRVREAFELALDREGIVQVVMDGEATVGNQWVAPNNPYYAKNVPMPEARRRAREGAAEEAGVPNPSFTLMTPTTSDAQRIAQVVQAMAQARPASTSRSSRPSSRPRSTWPTRASSRPTCSPGAAAPIPTATSTASTPASSRSTTPATASRRSTSCSTSRARTRDPAERKKVFEQIAARVLKDRPIVYLYHRNWLWAYNDQARAACATMPDGLVRVHGPEDGDAALTRDAPRTAADVRRSSSAPRARSCRRWSSCRC